MVSNPHNCQCDIACSHIISQDWEGLHHLLMWPWQVHVLGVLPLFNTSWVWGYRNPLEWLTWFGFRVVISMAIGKFMQEIQSTFKAFMLLSRLVHSITFLHSTLIPPISRISFFGHEEGQGLKKVKVYIRIKWYHCGRIEKSESPHHLKNKSNPFWFSGCSHGPLRELSIRYQHSSYIMPKLHMMLVRWVRLQGVSLASYFTECNEVIVLRKNIQFTWEGGDGKTGSPFFEPLVSGQSLVPV